MEELKSEEHEGASLSKPQQPWTEEISGGGQVSLAEFLRTLGHEARTHLSGIIGMTHLMHEAHLAPRYREYLAMIDSSAQSLLTTFNGILANLEAEASRRHPTARTPFNHADRLPAHGEEGPRQAPDEDRAQEPTPPVAPVLIVDDMAENRALARVILRRLGIECETASDGEEAVRAVQTRRYAAILMDWAMPRLDGLAAARIIREHESESGTRVPIIAVTANVSPTAREECLDAGMDDYLAKPIRCETLAASLYRLGVRGGK